MDIISIAATPSILHIVSKFDVNNAFHNLQANLRQDIQDSKFQVQTGILVPISLRNTSSRYMCHGTSLLGFQL